MIEIIMPQGGQDINKGQVVRWLKDVGERVQKGDVLCEVETEKASFEIESPTDGFLRKIVVPAGQDAEILSVIGFVGDATEPFPGTQASPNATAAPEPPVSTTVAQPTTADLRAPHKISPKARRIAEENGVLISELQGTGPGGRVLEKDVAEYISRRGHAVAAPSGADGPRGRLVALDKRRKATAQKMAASKHSIPHFYVTRSVDMTDALAYREAINSKLRADRLTEVSINDLIIRACAHGLQEFPQLNAAFQDDEHLMLWDDINIAVAVSVDDGLIAAILPKADSLPLQETARRTQELIQAARSGKVLSLAPATFTISNLGMYQVDGFVAIINSPESAVLAVASIRKQLVVQGSTDLRVRDMMNMTLSVDHRVCDGALAARFLNSVKSRLEAPDQLA